MLPSLSLPPLECCFGTSPIQAEKFRPDRKAFGSATLATRAVAKAGPTPGISSSRLLVSFDRCQARRMKFPPVRGRLEAPREKGVYVIYSPSGRIVHVGRTPRAKGGIAQRLKDH